MSIADTTNYSIYLPFFYGLALIPFVSLFPAAPFFFPGAQDNIFASFRLAYKEIRVGFATHSYLFIVFKRHFYYMKQR